MVARLKDYYLGLYEKSMPNTLTLREKLRQAKDAGFDFMEISIDETDEKLSRLEMSKAERKDLVDAMYQVGLPIKTMCLSGHRKYPLGSRDEKIRARGMEIMEKAIEFACDLGLRIIQLAGYDVYYEEGGEDTQALFLENLKKSAEMAAAAGVTLAFETMETEFMNTVEKAMKYVKLVDSPYFKVYPDSGNLTNAAVSYHTRVADDLETGRGSISAVHLKETTPGVFREVPYGAGHVDFVDVIKTAWSQGVRLYNAEFWYVGQKNWQETLRENNAFLREKFQRAQDLL